MQCYVVSKKNIHIPHFCFAPLKTLNLLFERSVATSKEPS